MNYGSLRSPWALVVWFLGLAVLLLGVAVMIGVPFSKAAFTISICISVGGWLCLTAPFSRVKISESGIKYRGFLKFWSIPWSDVMSVEIGAMREGHMVTTSVPTVRTTNGRVIQLAILSGYSLAGKGDNQRVQNQVERMERVLSTGQ